MLHLCCLTKTEMETSHWTRPNKRAGPSLSHSSAPVCHDVSHVFREFHREQLSIEHSMRDLDSAVGRLDNLLISVYVVVAILIIAVTLVCTLYHVH